MNTDLWTKLIDFVKGLMQPALTIVAIIVFFGLWATGYNPDDIFKVVVGIILFWFGYTAVKNFNFTGSAPSGKDESPKADGGQSTAKDDLSAVDEEHKNVYIYDTWDHLPPVAFDQAKFMDAVLTDVQGQYGETTDYTIYAEADAKLRGVAASWKFNNDEAHNAAFECLRELVAKAFKFIWGVDYQTALIHLNDNLGCTTCTPRTCTYPDLPFKARQLGMQYWAILRDYLDLWG